MNDLEQEKPTYQRPRARDLGITPGILPPGPLNAITDVAGVLVGQVTLMQGQDIRTGATAVLPHPDNIYQHKVPAGLAVGNGYGKLMGATQIVELGEIETPIVLTNTLAVPRAAEAILDWTLSYPGNEAVLSANPVVGETNDGYLNDIRQRTLTPGIIGTAYPWRIRDRWRRAPPEPAPERRLSDGRGASGPAHAACPIIWAATPSECWYNPITTVCCRFWALLSEKSWACTI
jgi:hypothetical protein